MKHKEFEILSRLGEGSFSSVWKVKRISDGQEYAMKKVKMASLSEKEKENALNEVRILASIKHPYIVGYKEAFFDDNSLTLCIVMEYAAGGDILKKIGRHQKEKTFFKEDDIWRYAFQIIKALKTLHDMKILHRDLKSANIFLSKDGRNVKIGDLNVSKVAKSNLVYTQTGTPYYASPEVWKDQPYDLKSDIWSLGCVLYEMCALKPPFRAVDMRGLYKKVLKGEYERIPLHYSSDLNHFISLCLQISPSARPNCDKLLNNSMLVRNGLSASSILTENHNVSNELLRTIRITRNIRALAEKLPKPNYGEAHSQEYEKGVFEKIEEKPIYSRRENRDYSQHLTNQIEEKLSLRKIQNRYYKIPSMELNPENREVKPLVKDQAEIQKVLKENVVSPSMKHPLSYGIKKESIKKEDPYSNIENKGDYWNIVKENNNLKGQIKELAPLKSKYSKEQYINNQSYLGSPTILQAKDNFELKEGSTLYDKIHKKAQNIAKKYHEDAELAEKREPLTEIKQVVSPKVKESNILQRYNNAFNFQESNISRKKKEYVHESQQENFNVYRNCGNFIKPLDVNKVGQFRMNQL